MEIPKIPKLPRLPKLPPEVLKVARQGVKVVQGGVETVQHGVDYVKSQNLRSQYNNERGAVAVKYPNAHNDAKLRLERELEMLDVSVRYSATAKERVDADNLLYFTDQQDHYDKPSAIKALNEARAAGVDVDPILKSYSWGAWII